VAEQQLGYQVVQHLGHTYRAMLAAFSAGVGHALPRWRILLALHEGGQCSQKQLAERCRLDPASLTRQLQSMQGLGWLDRSVDPADNRVTNVSLTALGRGVVEDTMPRREAFHDATLRGLTAQQIETFNEVLDVLENNFQRITAESQTTQMTVVAQPSIGTNTPDT
jgi:DNA-binding MarR family transcriptional regulator